MLQCNPFCFAPFLLDKRKMKQGYDVIAPIYDALAGLFIGKALRRAQVYFLYCIPANTKVLIVGGGTGWLLEEITKIHSQGLAIDYVDVSSKMIALAKQRNKGKNKVTFIHQSILDFTNQHPYDVIITPFLLDNFKEETARKVFTLLNQKLQTNGLWIYTDFQVSHPASYWQKAVLFLMYSFFRIAANIEASGLPNVAAQFNLHNYKLVQKQTFLRKFIITALYKKT